MIKQKINNFITKQVGTQNGSSREQWLEKTLSRLPENTTILDAGAGEGKYKKFCTHLDYKSQDMLLNMMAKVMEKVYILKLEITTI